MINHPPIKSSYNFLDLLRNFNTINQSKIPVIPNLFRNLSYNHKGMLNHPSNDGQHDRMQ
jgi:hypothetical protein